MGEIWTNSIMKCLIEKDRWKETSTSRPRMNEEPLCPRLVCGSDWCKPTRINLDKKDKDTPLGWPVAFWWFVSPMLILKYALNCGHYKLHKLFGLLESCTKCLVRFAIEDHKLHHFKFQHQSKMPNFIRVQSENHVFFLKRSHVGSQLSEPIMLIIWLWAHIVQPRYNTCIFVVQSLSSTRTQI